MSIIDTAERVRKEQWGTKMVSVPHALKFREVKESSFVEPEEALTADPT